MRRLEHSFLSDLKEGCLTGLTATVRSDTSLCLELRGDYINVYYRGGNLMELRQNGQSANEYAVSTQTQTTARYAHLADDPLQGASERIATSLEQALDR